MKLNKKMIFHIPMQIDNNLQSGSQIRPQKMIQAFENIGFDVDIVKGYVNQRKQQISKIKQSIRDGIKYEFIYSESSTVPTALTQKNHLPIAPFLDFDFFKFCKENNIKIGLFYRDIHWRFEQYIENISFLKRKLAELFYKYDLKQYKKYVDILYLPSKQMYEYVPIDFNKEIIALPPAMQKKEFISKKHKGSINFIYVGGLGTLYDLTLFAKTTTFIQDTIFSLCVREREWKHNKTYYNDYSVDIYYKSGDELSEIYMNSDIAVLFVKPIEYWTFAMAVKLFEYMSYKKPIIAVKNTAVGDFVEENDIGWTLEYDENELRSLIVNLQNNPSLIDTKIKNIEKIMPKHTWEARASQVAKELTQ